MNHAWIRYQRNKLKEYLAIKTGMVNHREVIREVAAGVDRSWIYYLMLIMAGLIALLGLLTNSVAVVIGAMLISPLMGPIISSGLALTIGDLPLARRAFRTIAISVAITILVSACVTLLSPLKEPTAEILARVRPNIYDLFIAVLSGIVGAVALCTKRNYLITATGVAVATAVIPPLSVAGYGLGTGQVMLGLGGFLLFFTNFVAIVLTSDLVFFIMGFRTSHVETMQYSQRKRLMIIGGLLVLISIPLVYTLVVDIRKMNTKKRIERVLKKHLNKENLSRMTGYTFQDSSGRIVVKSSVNTVSFIEKPKEQLIMQELRDALKTTVVLKMEQVLVASEQLPDHGGPGSLQAFETTAEISSKAAKLATQAEQLLAAALAPFPVTETRLAFSASGKTVQASCSLQRDWPVNNDERLLLARQLEQTLGVPLTLTVTATAFLPPLSFSPDNGLSPESIKALERLKQLPEGVAGYRFVLEWPKKQNERQLAVVRQHLIMVLNVRSNAISAHQGSAPAPENGTIRIRVVRKDKEQI